MATAQNREVLGEYKIAYIGQNINDFAYEAARIGAEDAALALSKKYSIDLELIDLTPNLSRGETQLTSMGQAFVSEADGIVLNPMPDPALAPSLQYANTLGQTVICIESAPVGAAPDYAILSDEYATGRMMGESILSQIPSGSRVAILQSSDETPSLQQRLAGVRSAIGYRRIEIVVTTLPDYLTALEVIQETEEADINRHIRAWIFLDDWPLQGYPSFPWKPGETPFIAFSSSLSSLIYMDQGYTEAFVTHPYYECGYQAMEQMVALIHLQEQTDDDEILMKPIKVDRSNIKDLRENWTHLR